MTDSWLGTAIPPGKVWWTDASQHHPPRATNPRTSKRKPWHETKRRNRGGAFEQFADGRQLRQRAIPGASAVGEPEAVRQRIRNGKSGAGDSIVESQHPHPAPGENVMDGGILGRVGGTVGCNRPSIEARDAAKVSE